MSNTYKDIRTITKVFLESTEEIVASDNDELTPMAFVVVREDIDPESELYKTSVNIYPELADEFLRYKIFPIDFNALHISKEAIKPLMSEMVRRLNACATIFVTDAYLKDDATQNDINNHGGQVRNMNGTQEAIVANIELNSGIQALLYKTYKTVNDKIVFNDLKENYSDPDLDRVVEGQLTGFFSQDKL